MPSPQKLRICIGSPDAVASPLWVLWARKNDVYMCTHGSPSKVSLHGSHRWRVAFTSESGKVATTSETNDRVLARWTRPVEFAPGWTQGPSIAVYAARTRRLHRLLPQHEGKAIVWLAAPPEGHKLMLLVLLSKHGASVPPTWDGFTSHGCVQHRDGETAWLVSAIVPLDDLEAAFSAYCSSIRVRGAGAQPPKVYSAQTINWMAGQPCFVTVPLGEDNGEGAGQEVTIATKAARQNNKSERRTSRRTGLTTAGCIASSRGDCSRRIADESFFSPELLELIGRLIHHTRTRLASGEELLPLARPLRSLACQRHLDTVRELDRAALSTLEALRVAAQASTSSRIETVDGYALERWLAKVSCALHAREDRPAPDSALALVLGERRLDTPQGLSLLLPASGAETSYRVAFARRFPTTNEQVAFRALGVGLAIVTAKTAASPWGDLRPLYRPERLVWRHEDARGGITLCLRWAAPWRGPTVRMTSRTPLTTG